MFEKVYGQQNIKKQLAQSILKNTLPSGIIFVGSRFTGRLTTAIEIARVVSCVGDSDENCTCENCLNSYAGLHPYTVLLLSRDLMKEIFAASGSYTNHPKPQLLNLFISQVRKLINRYRADLNEELTVLAKTHLKTAFEIDELLLSFEGNKKVDEAVKVKEIVKKSELLAASIKSGNIPVSQIRKISSWLYTTPENQVKCIIIEGIEGITDASKNALLKILEEPPKNTYFFLIAESLGRIPQTILSRVRKYQFDELYDKDKGDIIKETYSDDPDLYDSLKTFFMTKAGINCRELHDDAEKFLLSALNRDDIAYKDFQSMMFKINSKKLFPEFIHEIVSVLEQEVEDRLISREKAANILADVKTFNFRQKTYNQHPALSLETLYNTIRIDIP
ncbi:MAG: hypothetical protein KAQ69_10180 [Spirochaetales bacterium]|nr:hypothetical protein [Spirochaetales bacterium]